MAIYEFEFIYEPADENMPVKKFNAIVHNKVFTEKQYGQDADGNRGTAVTFIEFKRLDLYDEKSNLLNPKDYPLIYGQAIHEYEYFHKEKAHQYA